MKQKTDNKSQKVSNKIPKLWLKRDWQYKHMGDYFHLTGGNKARNLRWWI